MNPIVERERGLLELEQRIADLKAHAADQPVDSECRDRARSRQKYARDPARDLRPSHAVAARQHGASSEAPAGLGVHRARWIAFDELHGDRHFGDDPRDRRRLREAARPARSWRSRKRRAPTPRRRCARNFGMPQARGLSQGAAAGAAGRAPRPADRHVRRHVGRRSGDRLGRARAGRSDRPVARWRWPRRAVPIVATVIGEGGSGGALALALADHVVMLEHAVYSVASPEGCAAILWGDAGKAEEAAARLRLTSDDLRGFRHHRRNRPRAAGRRAPRPAWYNRTRLDCDRCARWRGLAAHPARRAAASGAIEKFRRIGTPVMTARALAARRGAVRHPRHRVLAFAVFVAVQYARIIERNVAYAGQIRDVQRDIAEPRAEARRAAAHDPARLSDPRGAIPEIHDRLHLVGDHEAIIYLKRPDGGQDADDRDRARPRQRDQRPRVGRRGPSRGWAAGRGAAGRRQPESRRPTRAPSERKATLPFDLDGRSVELATARSDEPIVPERDRAGR